MDKAFFQYHSKLDSFRLFSKEHFLTLAIIFILCTFLFIFRNAFRDSGKRRNFGIIQAVVLMLTYALQHIWLVYENAWSLKKDLPLQLSDLAVILAIIMLLLKNNKLFQFMYFAGLGSSIQAILTPDLGRFSFPHFQYFEFFISHGGVVMACLFMSLAYRFRPTLPSMWATILIVNLYAVCVFFLDKLLGANYLYIIKKPNAASLLDYLGPWPWYLLSLELVMILSFYILYCPVWIKEKWKR